MTASLLRTTLLCTTIVGAAASSLAAQEILVVGTAGPGVDFTTIDAAVSAANDGDTIFIRDGSFESIEIVGKSLTIHSELSTFIGDLDIGAAGTEPLVTIRDLGPDQSVTLNGFVLIQVGDSTGTLLEVHDCAGPILIEDVLFDSLSPALPISVTASDSVTFRNSIMQGGRTVPVAFGSTNSSALDAIDSNIFLFDCDISGPRGTESLGAQSAGPGGHGVRLEGSTLTAVDSSIGGGSAGSVIAPNCSPTMPGGDGLLLVAGATTPSAQLTNTNVSGSSGSFTTGCAQLPGANGQAFNIQAGSVDVTTDVERTLSVTSPAREGGTINLSVRGAGGDFVSLVTAVDLISPTFLSSIQSTLFVAPLNVLPFGVVPSNIQPLQAMFTVPTLPASVDGVVARIQPLYVQGTSTLGGPATVLLLDAGL